MIKIASILVIELITLYTFGWLQQFKYPAKSIHPNPSNPNDPYGDYEFYTLWQNFDLLMIIPEGYNCDTFKLG